MRDVGAIRHTRPRRGLLRARGLLAAAFVLAAVLPLSGCDIINALQGRTPTAGSVSQSPTSPAAPSVPPPASPLPLAGKVLPGPKVFLGVYSPPAPFDLQGLDTYVAEAGKSVAIVMWYQPWASNNRNEVDLGACAALLERGIVPMITWEPWDPGLNAKNLSNPGVNAKYRLSRIIAGDYDAYIRTWARGIKELGGPVMLRPMHEMNGNWYPWCGTANGNSPPQFKAAWIHIHKIFAEEGATNVTWVWSINHESVPATKANSFAAYYPGSAYVDWTSISGFNWGTVSRWSSWRSWSHWYAAPLAYLDRLGKPVCISEMGTVEKGGSKAAWITDAYKQILKYRRVRAVIYYNAREAGRAGTQDWRINTSVASQRAYRQVVANPHYSPGPAAALTQWQSGLSDADRKHLADFRRVY